MCPDNKIPQGLLLASTKQIENALDHFKKAKEMDSINESRPDMSPENRGLAAFI